jgi:hypothetical protein
MDEKFVLQSRCFLTSVLLFVLIETTQILTSPAVALFWSQCSILFLVTCIARRYDLELTNEYVWIEIHVHDVFILLTWRYYQVCLGISYPFSMHFVSRCLNVIHPYIERPLKTLRVCWLLVASSHHPRFNSIFDCLNWQTHLWPRSLLSFHGSSSFSAQETESCAFPLAIFFRLVWCLKKMNDYIYSFTVYNVYNIISYR